MIKVTMDIGRVTVQTTTAEECNEVMKDLLPKFLEMTRHEIHALPQEGEILTTISAPEEEEALTTDSDTIQNPIIKDSYTPTKRLVFFKCTCCGTIACSFMNPHEKAKCFHCNSNVYLNELFKGSYNCVCGQTGGFLMQDTVTEVPCKSCNKPQIMLRDTDNTFVGL